MSARGLPERWSDAQRDQYTRVYRFMVENQPTFQHPDSPRLADPFWETLAHNAAWIAVELAEDIDLVIEDSDTGQVLASSGHTVTH